MSMAAYFDAYAASYDKTLNAGLTISGEDSRFFACRRIEETGRALSALLPSLARDKAIDFGCGTGNSSYLLKTRLGFQSVCGIDASPASLLIASKRFCDPDLEFQTNEAHPPSADANLVFCNGVFHHIPPHRRPDSLAYIQQALAPGGAFVFWENNPWNPGVHYIMRSIPFDRDARMILPHQALRLLRKAGFKIAQLRFFFVFPKALAKLRRLEPALSRFPLGAQYQIIALKAG
jgi:trans-aconitate methyltransferase